MKYLLEIATSDFTTTQSAVAGGADRIELCSNLAEGGTTSSFGQLERCREAFSIPLYPIIRPRGGDFFYSTEEFDIMMKDVIVCRNLGMDGIVIGMLDKDGSIDRRRCARLVDLAYPMGVTFHRAFDRCRDPFQALEDLVAMGCERLLTSGQQPAAPDGAELIAQLQAAAGERIIIMPGSGVREDNIAFLAQKTGCREFHSSLRSKSKSAMEYIHPAFSQSEESYMNNAIDASAISRLKIALSNAGI